MKDILCLASLLSICFIVCLGQNPAPHFRNYTTNHGLPSPEVHCIFQDTKGYMWFGTDNGASRFDGYKFDNYGAAQGLLSNVVLTILEDGRGRIWFSTMTGDVFIFQGDTIMPYKYNSLIESQKPSYAGSKLMHIDQEERAYFRLKMYGVFIIDSMGNSTLVRSKNPDSRILYTVDKKIYSTICLQPQREDFQSWRAHFIQNQSFHFETYNGTFSFEKELPRFSTKGGDLFPFTIKQEKGILILLGLGGLFILEDTSVVLSQKFSPYVLSHHEDESNGFWLGLGGGEGLRYYQNRIDLVDSKYQSYLQGRSISAIFTDKDNGLWITTLQNGIYYTNNKQLQIFNNQSGFPEDFVSTVAFKNPSELYVGFANGEVWQFNPQNCQGKNLKKPFYSLGSQYINDLYFDSLQNILWSDKFYFKNSTWEDDTWWPESIDQRSSGPIGKKWFFDKEEAKLWNVKSNGFYMVNPKTQLVEWYSWKEIPNERAYAVYRSIEGKLWVGQNQGLFEYSDNKLISSEFNELSGKIRVEDIIELPDSTLLLGTKGKGVFAWKKDTIIGISTKQGLASNMVEDLHYDKDSNLYVGTLNGLSIITFDSNLVFKISTFGENNGLPSNEIYNIKSYDGQVWLCTAGGLVKWMQQPLNETTYLPIIRGLRLNGQLIQGWRKKFSHNENSIAFEFISINYKQSGQIPYRYRINQQDSWSYSSNRTVDFAKLSPGSFEFEVQAQNEDGMWSDSAMYPFEISSPWWSTRGFILLAIVSIIGALYFLYKNRINRVKERSETKNTINHLKLSAMKAQMNPHFIFNCLNSIQSFINQGKKEKANYYLVHFSKMVRGCLNASLEKEIPLESEIGWLKNYLELESMRFPNQFDYSIEADDGIDLFDILIPPMLIQPFVENAILHGLLHEGRNVKGRVEIKFKQENDFLISTIEDNGIGIEIAKTIKSQNEKFHKSVGISITQRRLELLNSKEQLGEWLVTEELRNNQDEVLGTKVIVKIRIDK